jgi:hypothetical protein
VLALIHAGPIAGLAIGNLVHRRLPVEPWQLTGSPTPANWDPRLGEAMRDAARCVEEELVAATLMEELA